MRYMQCKCGKQQAQTSGESLPQCAGCEECGTTYASNAATHQPLIPHDLRNEYTVNRMTGERSVTRRCSRTWCMYREEKKALGDALQ